MSVLVAPAIAALRQRRGGDGGFAGRDGGGYRPDATAWAILALQAAGGDAELVAAARGRLAAGQLQDGRVGASAEHPEAFWPTPLAVLAWHRAPAFQEAQSRAAKFLLATTGDHWKRRPEDVIGHDPNLRGWPWIAGIHSWVEPTGMAMIALTVAGLAQHDRVREGTRLLLNRQLPGGGWNYGNTTVLDQELLPMPATTGIALDALNHLAPREQVSRSLDLLAGVAPRLTTPFSLGWAVLGLSAWGVRPAAADAWLEACLSRQDKYGQYDTALLSLLIVARAVTGGLGSIFT